MNLKVVDRKGRRIGYKTAALESRGKTFILVLILDYLIGWLAMPGTKLRVFNYLSHTIVSDQDRLLRTGQNRVREGKRIIRPASI